MSARDRKREEKEKEIVSERKGEIDRLIDR